MFGFLIALTGENLLGGKWQKLFCIQGTSTTQVMCVSKYNTHKIASLNNIKNNKAASISFGRQNLRQIFSPLLSILGNKECTVGGFRGCPNFEAAFHPVCTMFIAY